MAVARESTAASGVGGDRRRAACASASGERADAQPSQHGEVRAAPERDAEIGRQRADVGAAPALDQHGRLRVRPRLEVLDDETVDVDATRRALDVDARARELVEPATADLHRRHHRRELLDVAEEARRPRPPRLGRARAASVAARRRRPTASSVLVAMPNTTRPRYDLPASWRNRRSRVARPRPTSSTPVASGSSVPAWPTRRCAVDPAQLGDDVVRRPARRLVDDDEPVLHRPALTESWRSERVADARDDGRRGRASDSKPAANRCPPPPWAAAIARTSTSPSERRLTRTLPSGSSFTHARDLGFGGAAEDVDEALDLFEGHPVAFEHVLGDRRPHEPPVDVELRVRPAPRASSLR